MTRECFRSNRTTSVERLVDRYCPGGHREFLVRPRGSRPDGLPAPVVDLTSETKHDARSIRAVSSGFITVRALSKRYVLGGATIDALAGVDLDIAPGDGVALMGPSGSGKTTLLNLIGGLDVPTSGAIKVDGRDLGALSRDELALYRRSTVGFVFQAFRLLPHLTARENIALPLLLAGADRARVDARARELLERVGLRERAGHRPAQLSAGEQQRVATARAIAQRPKILLADEPTGNLDAAAAADLLTLFAELRAQDGLTLLIATHNPDVAARADRVVALRGGRVEAPAPA